MQFMPAKWRAPSASLTPSSPRRHSLRVKRNWSTSGWVMLWKEFLTFLEHLKKLLHAPGTGFGFLGVVQPEVDGVAVGAVEGGVEGFGLRPLVELGLEVGRQAGRALRVVGRFPAPVLLGGFSGGQPGPLYP